MALPWLQRFELLLFTAAFLCGAVAAATLTRTQGSFSSHCPLYGVAALNGSSLALSQPSAPSLCYFVAGVSGLLALYCLLLLLSAGSTALHRGLPQCLPVSFDLAPVLLCKSIVSLNITISEQIAVCGWNWIQDGHVPHALVPVSPQTSSWVNLVLWCVVLMLQVVQWKSEATPYRPLERGDPEWSSETDVLVGPRLSPS
uniref:Transmembrane protein 179B n=1 Tax=Lynx canadensis TaxID=61383 RepID=A0A667HZE0_LYNCA